MLFGCDELRLCESGTDSVVTWRCGRGIITTYFSVGWAGLWKGRAASAWIWQGLMGFRIIIQSGKEEHEGGELYYYVVV